MYVAAAGLTPMLPVTLVAPVVDTPALVRILYSPAVPRLMAERLVAARHTPSVSLDATHVSPVVHCIVEADEVPHKHGYAAIGAPAISEHTGGDEWADVWTNELRATTRARACLDMAYAEAQMSEKGDSLDKLKVTNLS